MTAHDDAEEVGTPPRSPSTRLLRLSPLQPLFALANRRAFVAIAYHSVNDPNAFAAHIDYLASRYHPVSLAEVIGAIGGRSALPSRAVLVTFDDGDKTIIENALPVMKCRGVPGVLFAVAGHIDSDRPYWWQEAEDLVRRGGRIEGWEESDADAVVRRLKREEQDGRLAALEELRQTVDGDTEQSVRGLSVGDLRILDAEGIAVENHTLTHPSLDRCDPETTAEEIEQAHSRLAGILGREPVAFAYPGGYHAEHARAVLESLGYRAAFLFDHRLNRLPITDSLRISRVRIDADASVDRLAVIMSGLHPALLHATGRV